MISGRIRSRRKEVCQILGKEEERGERKAEGPSRRLSEKRQKVEIFADYSPATVSEVCAGNSQGYGTKMVEFLSFTFYLNVL